MLTGKVPKTQRNQINARFRQTTGAFFRPTNLQQNHCNKINSAPLNKLQVVVGGRPMKALLDSGSSMNLISKEAVERAGLITTLKENPVVIHVASGGRMPGQPIVTHQTTTTICIGRYQTKITLDVACLAGKDLILGLPWLRETNPRVDWKTGTLSFEGNATKREPQTTHRQSPVVEKIVCNTT